jgi:hypothetical protein
MKLIELHPRFLDWIDDTHYKEIFDITIADGIVFLCPKCLFENNNSLIGVHSIICWKPNIPQTTSPIPGRWNILGTGFNDLELQAGSSSVLLTSGCNAHFFIKNGEIILT